MALENLLISVKRKIGGIRVDGVITESTQVSMRITNNPVENGFNISDHVIEEPIRYSMTGVITDTPIGAAAVSELAGSVVDSLTGLFGQSENSSVTRSKQAYLELLSLMRKKEIITVDTTLKKYEDLLFESLSVNTDKNTANGISFSATFVQVLFVSSARRGVSPENIDGDENSAGYSDKSNAGYNSAVAPTVNEDSSIESSLGQ